MSDTSELKDLLTRLKTEVGEPPPERPAVGEASRAPAPVRPQAAAFARPQTTPPRREGPYKPVRPPEPHHQANGASANSAWSENKETILFGMLASVVMALGGIVASVKYLVLMGSLTFFMFALIMTVALAAYGLRRRGASHDHDLAAKLEQLSRKVDGLAQRDGAARPGASAASGGGNEDLERQVEELRILVRSLSKAVEDK